EAADRDQFQPAGVDNSRVEWCRSYSRGGYGQARRHHASTGKVARVAVSACASTGDVACQLHDGRRVDSEGGILGPGLFLWAAEVPGGAHHGSERGRGILRITAIRRLHRIGRTETSGFHRGWERRLRLRADSKNSAAGL